MPPCRLLYTTVLLLMVYPLAVAHQVAGAPPVGYLFAAFLGYNPLATMIPASVLNALPAAQAANITSRAFFPSLIDTAFHHGLVEVLIFAIIMCLIGAVASWVRGGIMSIMKRVSPRSCFLLNTTGYCPHSET